MSELLAGVTAGRASAFRVCRLCDERRCTTGAGCPADPAIGA
ncbi:MAG TPA: hypothetical protein VGH27_16700 [Streptosporangiaceae bacterium]